jgi:ubiquitin C-terminal hydrolase
MAQRYVIDANLPSYNSNVYQSTPYLIGFRVCKTKNNQRDYMYIESWSSDTIAKLKDTIARYFNMTIPLSEFSLLIYNEIQDRWEKIDNKDSSASIKAFKLREGSILSVEYHDYGVSKNQRPLYSAVVSNNKYELILKLCMEPMNTTYSKYINIDSSSTLGNLRKQVYEKLNKLAKNQPIYRWDNNQWMRFDSELDDCTLSYLEFESYAYISIDYDDDNSGSKPASGLCGLANLGSTCFMNSVFQCLSNIPEFTKKILAFNEEVNAPIIGEYIKLIKQIWSGKSRCIEPSLLVDNISHHLPHYDNYRQQDAQEFMNHFLHLIHAELSTKETLITELFYGRTQSTVKCLGCQRSETTNESISFLPLPISNHNQKNILYIKIDGEQRLTSVQVNSSVFYIRDLIDCFIKQHEPTLTREKIEAFQFIDNHPARSHDTWTSLSSIREDELVFLELPEKSTNYQYIWCKFYDHSTRKLFRPSSVLVCPTYRCCYSHLSEQIHQLLGHLCSITGAPIDDCHLRWIDRDGKQYKLYIEDTVDGSLPYLESISIELATKWVEIYKQVYDFNHSNDNTGLRSLLADFFREEPLDGDYHCLQCPKLTKARQKSNLCLPLPPVLIIQLKRFTYDNYSNDKIDTFISFPLDGLDLNEYIVKDDSKKSEDNPSTKYNLVAVSNHTGSLTCGHYTTYAKNIQDGKWYSFDDRIVRKLDSDKDVITKNAYILVYVQKPNEKS